LRALTERARSTAVQDTKLRVVFSTYLLAVKIISDVSYANAAFLRRCPWSQVEINSMEREMLKHLDFNVFIASGVCVATPLVIPSESSALTLHDLFLSASSTAPRPSGHGESRSRLVCRATTASRTSSPAASSARTSSSLGPPPNAGQFVSTDTSLAPHFFLLSLSLGMGRSRSFPQSPFAPAVLALLLTTLPHALNSLAGRSSKRGPDHR
jgi:hypothetical protein